MIPRLQPTPRSELDAIHSATLAILAETGVRFPSAAALTVLERAGAAVDTTTMVVRLPAALVEKTVAMAPREVLLAGRDPAQDALLDGSRIFVTLDGTGAYTLDHRSGERRASTSRDLAEATLIADFLPEIGVMWNVVSAGDTSPAIEVLEELAIVLRNTGKHIQGEVQRPEEVPYIMEMLAAASDGGRWDPHRPIFSIVYCPVAPLQHEREMLEAAIALARERVPMSVYSMGLAGATAPVTLAGAVGQANAEILSSIVLLQLIEPGTPIIYVADTGILDMRAGIFAAAGPEAMLFGQLLAGLARLYDLPVMTAGFTADANDFSLMAGLDDGMSALSAWLTGPDLLVGLGMFDGAQMLSLPKIVLDAEVVRQLERLSGGVAVDPAHLMTDVVAAVGPGGHYLRQKATRGFLREGEHHQPELLLRESYETWRAQGRSEVERAVVKVEAILATHKAKPLPDGAEERLAQIIARAAGTLAAR